MSNYQEQILDYYRLSDDYTPSEMLSVIKDCFTISRLQTEITELSCSAAWNERLRIKMEEKQKEVEAIICKYPITKK